MFEKKEKEMDDFDKLFAKTFDSGYKAYKKGKITYQNKDTYTGWLLKGTPKGEGIFTEISTGNVFEGYFVKGVRSFGV